MTICLLSVSSLSFWMEVALLGIVVGHHQYLTVFCLPTAPEGFAPLFNFRVCWDYVEIFFVSLSPLIKGLVVETVWVFPGGYPVGGSSYCISLIVLDINFFAESIELITK